MPKVDQTQLDEALEEIRRLTAERDALAERAKVAAEFLRQIRPDHGPYIVLLAKQTADMLETDS